ncbi:MAG: DUF11 domain-containing protein, partial [Anaerolineae bacterium]
VGQGVTLTVQPGVTVRGRVDAELRVLGYLAAIGEPGQPITFTSDVDSGRDQWQGLVFDGGTGYLRYATVKRAGNGNSILGTATNSPGSNLAVRNVLTGEVRLEESTVSLVQATSGVYQYADYGLYVDNSHMTISNTLFTSNGNNSADYGLYATGAGSQITLSAARFDSNSGYGLRLHNGQASMRCGGASSNGSDGVYITGGAFDVLGAALSGNGSYGLRNTSASSVDARYNWWGAADGPGGSGPGSGNGVSSNVLYDPWLRKDLCVSPTDADLALAIVDAPDPVQPGAVLTYTVTITNYGPLGATAVVLSDPLPAGVTFVTAIPDQGTCSEAGGVVSCSLGALASQASIQVRIVITTGAAGTLTNTVTVTAAEPDPDLGDNSAVAQTVVSTEATP